MADKKRRGMPTWQAPGSGRSQGSRGNPTAPGGQHDPSVQYGLRGSTLTALTDGVEIKAAYDLLVERMTRGATRFERTMGFPGGSVTVPNLYWRPLERIWAIMGSGHRKPRYFCGLGTQDPTERDNLTNDCPINVPREGRNLHYAGAFVNDEGGRIFLVHSGKVGGGRSGVGKAAFRDFYGVDRLVTVHWPHGHATRAFVIGALDDEQLPAQIARFVYKVKEFRGSLTR